jgi:hypothetical protein
MYTAQQNHWCDVTQELPQLLDRIYEAALEPRLWDGVADGIADALNATVVNISRHDGVTHRSTNIAPRVAAEFTSKLCSALDKP